MASVVGTWTFSRPGVASAARCLQEDLGALHAVESGISTVELDPSVTSVGYGGLPNEAGVLQLDAALMTGDGQAGAVMAVERFPAAIPLARLVLERSPHTTLAGEGAMHFARNHGMHPCDDLSSLVSPHAKTRYEQYRKGLVSSQPHQEGPGAMPHTDTVGMIARDASGAIVAGCATSGMEFKAVGRVGDSPVIGAGLFASDAGAAVATGDGDTMMRFCVSFLVVERMRSGDSPDEACRHAMSRMHTSEPTCQAAVVAMSAKGVVGAAGTHRGFHVVRWSSDTHVDDTKSFEAASVGDETWEHSCI